MSALILCLTWIVWGICTAVALTYERAPSPRSLWYVVSTAGLFVGLVSVTSASLLQSSTIGIVGAVVGLVIAATAGGLRVAGYRRDRGAPDLSSSGFAYGAASPRFWALLVPSIGLLALGLDGSGWYFPDGETLFGLIPAVYDTNSVTSWIVTRISASVIGLGIWGFLFYRIYRRAAEEKERLAFDLGLVTPILVLGVGSVSFGGLESGQAMELSRVESNGTTYVTLSAGRGTGTSSPVLARVGQCTLGLCSYQLLTSATGAGQQMLLRPASLEDGESDRLVVAPDGRLVMLNESNCAYGLYDPATGTALFDPDGRAAEAGVFMSDELAPGGAVSDIPPLVLIAEDDTLHPDDVEAFRTGKSTCRCCDFKSLILDVGHPNEAARALARELAD